MTPALRCTCGAAVTGRIPASVERTWRSYHSGPGHAPATADQARRARGRAEREANGEERP